MLSSQANPKWTVVVAYVHMYMYVCMYVCMYMYMYVHVCVLNVLLIPYVIATTQ